MVFVGLRWVRGANNTAFKTMHINTNYIRVVDEKEMTVTMDTGEKYRIDEESMEVFLTAVYGPAEDMGEEVDR